MTVPIAVFLNESGQADCVSARSLSKCIRGAASSLGLNSAEFSAHSLRAGGATHMYRAGVDALTIQFHGRWVSDTFKQYTRLCKESVDGLAAQIVSGQNT
jgi:site-specific recombinase XerD